MAIKRRDDRVRLNTISRIKRIYGTQEGTLVDLAYESWLSHWVQAGMKPVLVYTVQHAFYKDNIKKSNCDHKENLKS